MNVTPERWQAVARIYELAIEQDPSTRDAFLAEACAGDEALCHEVASLLREDDSSVVLDHPVWAAAASVLDEGLHLVHGASLGPYRIEGLLGAGGMGEVFRATDTRLNRLVAIKVLPSGITIEPPMRARFAREARAVAALTHPHICTLYDVGCQDEVDFLVMEYLGGETLAARLAAGRVPVDQTLTYAMEIAGALDHAHGHGIVHRDLKPANIMLTPSGVKLLDFGLAKLRRDADVGLSETGITPGGAAGASEPDRSAPSGTDDVDVTRDGTILGTLRYMAPEQILRQKLDARSDLFSFGAVIYEMLTGTRAFEGDDATSVREAILEHDPLPASVLQPQVPAALAEIVRRCLVKDPDNRWQTAADIVRELQQFSDSSGQAPTRSRRTWLAAGLLVVILAGLAVWMMTTGGPTWWRPGQIRSVAVLPFENLSGDREQEFFADGMTEQLIADLARIPGLRVISRTSVMQYRNAPKPAATIVKELGVDALVEASVARDANNVRITAKLIRGASGEVVWAQSYERDLRDVLALQGEVARTIASEVGITLTPQEGTRFARTEPVKPEVHLQVLLARYHLAKSTEEGARKAIEHFDAAIATDPENALAHAGLAEAYTELSGFYVHPREIMPKAKQAAEAALRLDESLADAHATLGFIRLVYDWDGPAAEKELLRALDLNPTLALARLRYAAYLASQARHDESVREVRRAVALDPLSARTHTFGSMFLMFSRRYDEAIELAGKALALEPNAGWAMAFRGVAYAEQRRFDEAIANLERAVELDNSATVLALYAHVLALAGRKEHARTVIQQVEERFRNGYFCPYEIGHVYVSLGEHDRAVDWFRKGVSDRADCMAWLGVEPWIDPFRSDPRYALLLRDIGLTPHAR